MSVTGALALHRASFTPSTEADAERLKFADKLAEKLGFEANKQKMAYDDYARQLHEIGATPFKVGTVRRYKRWMSLKERGFAAFVGWILAAVVLLSGFLWWTNVPDAQMPRWASTAWVGTPWLLSVVATGVWAIFAGIAFFERRATWERISIAQYPRTIPDHAAEKALKIAAKFEKCGLAIEELKVDRERIEWFRDPFLTVLIDGYQFHVDVWDEPGFEPKLRF